MMLEDLCLIVWSLFSSPDRVNYSSIASFVGSHLIHAISLGSLSFWFHSATDAQIVGVAWIQKAPFHSLGHAS